MEVNFCEFDGNFWTCMFGNLLVFDGIIFFGNLMEFHGSEFLGI
jgi:hypothetical protein